MNRCVSLVKLIGLLALLVCAALLAGCGNNQTSADMPPPSATTTPKVAATGPAISTTLTFDQLALETPVKKVKGKNGLVFLQFAYADNDGKIYKCELPEAMSKGEYSPEEWVRTFNIYRRPEVIGQKTRPKKGPQAIGDFPFISPKPQQVEAPTTEPAPTPTEPLQMPTLPPMPTQPQTQPAYPRPVPSVSPMTPRG